MEVLTRTPKQGQLDTLPMGRMQRTPPDTMRLWWRLRRNPPTVTFGPGTITCQISIDGPVVLKGPPPPELSLDERSANLTRMMFAIKGVRPDYKPPGRET